MANEKRIRILVAEDHAIVREGLVAILSVQPDMLVVAEAANGKEAVAAFRIHHPDIVLMDLVMPEMNGHEATASIRRDFPNARILVLTTFHGDADIHHALRAGARGYLLKDTPKKEFLQAIRAVHAGQRCIPPEVAKELAEHMPASDLTTRELDVLKLIVKGLGNKEIAGALSLTEGTVKSYIHTIFSKLGADDRTQAAALALQRGIIHLD